MKNVSVNSAATLTPLPKGNETTTLVLLFLNWKKKIFKEEALSSFLLFVYHIIRLVNKRARVVEGKRERERKKPKYWLYEYCMWLFQTTTESMLKFEWLQAKWGRVSWQINGRICDWDKKEYAFFLPERKKGRKTETFILFESIKALRYC